MDTFQLNILIRNILQGNIFTEEEYDIYISELCKANLSFTKKLQLNLTLRKIPLITSNKKLLNKLRLLFPYYKTN